MGAHLGASILDNLSLHVQVRGITRALLEGIWSDPQEIMIEDFPPPAGIVPVLVSAVPVVQEGVESFEITLAVNYNTPSPLGSVEKRQAIESGMSVTMYTLAVGFEPVDGDYGEVPMSSIQSSVVSWEGL
jgi:hypothetical protein